MTDDLENRCHEELEHTDGPVTRKLKEQASRIEKLELALHKLSDACDCWPAVQERGLARKLLETEND